MTRLFLAAALADTATMLLLPKGGEYNGFAALLIALSPFLAVAAKLAVVSAGTIAGRTYPAVLVFGAWAMTFAAASNVLTIAWARA